MNPRLCLLIGGGLALVMPGAAWAANSEEDFAFFEKKIRPVLVEACYECHSVEAGKRKGGLYLDNRESLLRGGDSGSPFEMNHAAASLLVRAMRHEPDVEAMPPEKRLPETVVADFEQWISMGAPDPRDGRAPEEEKTEINFEEARKFWSFQPLAEPMPPAVADAAWSRTDMDRFVLAKLEARDLRPAPDAGKGALLRRVTMALTGLPPTIAEQDAFLTNDSEKAFEEVVDRLLSTRAYAERWGRHWLDICRYSDTSGGGRAIPFPNAWRFRDYVIDSFAKDKPLDRMIREHIAGDLLPADGPEHRNEQLTATGFLVLGPNNYENQDKDLLDLEIVDEQMDTIGRAFMGMTIGCARCHDHKFDPIPTRDYYAMAGIFLSTDSVRHSNVSKWTSRALSPDPEKQNAFDAIEKQEEKVEMRLKALKAELDTLGPAGEEIGGIIVDDEDAEFRGDWPESTAVKQWYGKSYRHDDKSGKGEKSAAFTATLEKPGRYELRVSYNGRSGRSRTVPVTVTHLGGETTVRVDQRRAPEHDGLFHTIGEFEFAVGQATVVIGTQGTGDGHVIADAVQFLPLDAQEKSEGKVGEIANRRATVEKEMTELQKEKKALAARKPKLPTAMAVLESAEAEDTAVRIRGMAHQHGETVPRGFLQVVDRGVETITSGSGRLELAEWVASAENPLTARVLANRIWLHLFGEGIVPSPDNFGLTGRAPTHPELLDYLARRLIENRWSTKKTIREIVLSRAWQMSVDGDEARGRAVDPENTLLWKFRLRRLDAEELRDALLAFSGELNLKSGGPSLPAGFKSEFGYEFKTKRRTVYVPVFRNQMHEIFSTFDFANPNFVVGKRSSNAVPTQSLFLMNSPFVHKSATGMSERLLKESTNSAEDRLETLWRTVLGRSPMEEEKRLSMAFLESETRSTTPTEAWASVVRGLFSCVDFQYIQ
ncbi:MAG: DUF1553 domain-containing protein [Verrucomicrobiota bacterium]